MAHPKIAPGELVGLLEIAELMGVQKETTWRWRARHLMPQPVAVCSGTPIWTRLSILEWAERTGRLNRVVTHGQDPTRHADYSEPAVVT